MRDSPSDASRRLAALWFADLVGYTPLAARDENAAILLVQQFQAAVREAAEPAHGRVVKFVGDAALVEFPTTESAVHAALELGRAFARAPLRIGVHVGEVVSTADGDVYGDGVNTASRLQAEAEPGSVLVSEDVWRQLRSRPDQFHFEPAGERRLRGMEHPIKVFSVAPADPQESRDAAFSAPLPSPAARPQGARRLTWNSIRPGRAAAAGGMFVLLLGLALGLVHSFRGAGPDSTADEDRVVVAPFENQTGDPSLDPIGRMAADWITQGLSRTALIDVVPPTAAFASAQRVASLSSPDPIRALAVESGAGVVVSGTFYRSGDSLHFQVDVTDATRGRLLRSLDPVVGSMESPTEAIEQIRQRALAALAPLLDERLGAAARVASQPPSYEAYREYAHGMDRFIARDWRGSIERFERASSNDSTYTLPLLYRAIAHTNLGQYARTDSLLRVLDGSREQLAPYDEALLDMVFGWVRGDPASAHKASLRAASLAPNTLPHVQAALEALRLNRPREVIEIAAGIDPTRGEVRGWVSYWRVLTEAHHLLDQHQEELEVARRARELFPDDPHHLLYEARAMLALGHADAARSAVEARLSMRENALPNAGDFMLALAHELRAHGHTELAGELYQRATTWYGSRSAQERRRLRLEYADALYHGGRFEEARALLRDAVAEDPENLTARGRLGTVAARLGDSREAERAAAWLAAQEGRPYTRGRHTRWQASIAALLGRNEEAVRFLREAQAQGYSFGIEFHTDSDLDGLRGDASFAEFLKPKD